jgi:ABC-type sugar transport system ATPase subunit
VYGIYHDTSGAILYQGERKTQDPTNLAWREVVVPQQVQLLQTIPIDRLVWLNNRVQERDEVEQAAIDRQAQIDRDEQFITAEQLKAFAAVVLDEINRLRELHGLNPRTPEQLRTAFHQKLNR